MTKTLGTDPLGSPLGPNAKEDDHFHDECGVFGIYGTPDAAALTALGLHALQHRGQEACGVVAWDSHLPARAQSTAPEDIEDPVGHFTGTFSAHRGMGLVSDNFSSQSVIDGLPGSVAIGHNRYATCGASMLRNVQPIFADLAFGGFAIAHNGNLTNAYTLRESLVGAGAIFQSTSDTEVIVHLVARSHKATVLERVTEALGRIEGAYSLVIVAEGRLMGVRDPHGVRPLCLGRLGDAYVLASETCAFDIIGAEYVRDIDPGEMVVIDADGVRSLRPFEKTSSRFCIFEYVYFARPDSLVDGRSVYEARKRIGAELAQESPAPGAELVVPVPDSGVPSAIGYAEAAGLPFDLGIIRNHYVGRTFIEPSDSIRHLGVKLKHNANAEIIRGRSIVLVDDSIVRGTTSRKIVEMLRQAGARAVHMRISCPPTRHSCFYGIDTPTTAELLANRLSVDEIREYIGVDSLAYVSLDGLYRALRMPGRDNAAPQFCDACLTGDYAIRLTDFEGREDRTRTVSSMGEAAA
ncbi:MAG: amidophosphoribosyltransferase [Rhodospirillales bacterium]|nr:amidophosphoribosyltransferase [Rhodospirillales bacterium]USO08490.1 MAG: amidophosphoribosyltransferase [Rhodospirillales bacterium]